MYKKIKTKNTYVNFSKGFSLVEAIFYISLLTVVLVSTVNMLLAVTQSYRSVKLAQAIERSASVSFERMTREIRQAMSIDSVGSTLGSSPGTLVLRLVDQSGNNHTTTFSVEDGGLILTIDGVEHGRVTSSNVSVLNLVFNRIYTGISEAVKIEMTLQSSQGDLQRSDSFYTTVVLKGSY